MYSTLLYALLGLTSPTASTAAETSPLPEQPGTDIGYPSPEAALKALRVKPGVSIREENDWYIAQDPGESTIWSITRPSHPAHPSAVKRSFEKRNGTLYLSMKVDCGSSKENCDRLVRQFQELNAQMVEAMRRKQP